MPNWLFPVLPLVTGGWATLPAFVYAAVVSRARWVAVAGAMYVAPTIGMLTLGNDTPWFEVCVLTNALAGTAHAIAIRRWLAQDEREARTAVEVVRRPAGAPAALLDQLAAQERSAAVRDPLLRAAVHQRERRRLAREIVTADPKLAAELGIGRPSGEARFDDGGLIDVNVVDAAVLATLPGVDAPMAARVVSARERLGGLRSTADLVVHADVPAEVAEQLADRLLFGPV